MKINKKGFTLIELLAVIGVLGLVLAISTYFIINSITGSKEKAFELSKKGLLDSAITYANEFNEEEDWVDAYPEYEYTCVNAWWLVNKGMQKKEIFTEDQNEKYKFKKSAVIVLERNKDNKVIENAYLPENNEKECKNTLSAEINLTSTYNSITVTGTCKMKETVPNDIHYKFCRSDNNECHEEEENSYTFTGLTNDYNYTFSLQCLSEEHGNSNSIEDNIDTDKINEPEINCDNSIYTNYVSVKFNNDDSKILKSLKVNDEKVKFSNQDVGTTSFKYYTQNSVEFNIGNITNEKVKFTAKVSLEGDDNPSNIKSQEKECGRVRVQETAQILAPYFSASDDELSGTWHKNDYTLSISSNNTVPVDYYYGTSYNSINTPYQRSFSALNETTYYAMACEKNNQSNCSEKVSYNSKIDKDAPTINYTISHELTADEKDVMGVTEQELEHALIEQTSPKKNYYSYNETESSYLAWLAYDIKINFSISDSGSGLNARVKYGKSGDDSTSITSLTTTNKTLTLSNNNTTSSFSDKITANGYKRVYLRACDVAGNCTEKNIYFKIDKKLPEITRTDNGTGNNSFTCTSGLAGINRFFATGDSDNLTHKYIVNGSTSTGAYWLDDSKKGHIYLTCSSKSFNFITKVPKEHWSDWGTTGYRPNILSRLITNGTYSYKPKGEGGKCYKWGCVRYGVSGYRPIYTASDRNPYGEHCGKEYEYDCGTSSCPTGFNNNPVTKGCYSFGTYAA